MFTFGIEMPLKEIFFVKHQKTYLSRIRTFKIKSASIRHQKKLDRIRITPYINPHGQGNLVFSSDIGLHGWYRNKKAVETENLILRGGKKKKRKKKSNSRLFNKKAKQLKEIIPFINLVRMAKKPTLVSF